MKLNCQYVDTCLPDYWPGNPLPHVQIPVVSRKMSLKSIRAAICNELRQGAVMGTNDDAWLLSADFVPPDKEKVADMLTRAAYAAVNRDIRGVKPGQRGIDTGIDVNDEDACTCYMYFVFSRAY